MTTNTTTINVVNGEVVVTFSKPVVTTISGTRREGNSFIYEEFALLTAEQIAFQWADLSPNSSYNKKEVWGIAAEILGCTCRLLSKMLKGAMYRVWIAPHPKEAFGLAYGVNLIGKRIWGVNNLKLLKEAAPDMPLFKSNMRVFAVICSEPKLKHLLGEELWQKLELNSFSRNCLILKQYLIYDRNRRIPTSEIKTIIGFLAKVRSTLLQSHYTDFNWIIDRITKGKDNIITTYGVVNPKTPLKEWRLNDYIIEVIRKEELPGEETSPWEELIF